jgi:hypothetical protein
MSSPGDPALPLRVYEVAVPPNIDWKTINISEEKAEKITLPGKYDIAPAPPFAAYVRGKVITSWGEGKNIVNGKNMRVYEKRVFYPAKSVSIVATSQMRKWKFIRIGFVPAQYNPATKKLRFKTSVQVRITFDRIGKRTFRSHPLLKDNLMDDEAKRRFINYKDALEWYHYIPLPQSGKEPEDPDYVIITTNTIRDSSAKLNDFVDHKTLQGHSVLIVTEDDYGTLTGQAPNGRAEKIRQWLIDNYNSLGILYVLLIGNPDPGNPTGTFESAVHVPMKMFWPLHYWPWQIDELNHMNAPSDYFYADLTGNWDIDADGVFGEYYASDRPTTPDPALNPETYSVRYSGKILIENAGNYYFRSRSRGGGFRLIIDGNSVIDYWVDHGLTERSGSINLAEGFHDITIEFQSIAGDAMLNLYWNTPTASYYTSAAGGNLYHLNPTTADFECCGLSVEYFNDLDFSTPVSSGVGGGTWFYWGAGDRGPGGMDFAPEVYVGRIPVYPPRNNGDVGPYETLDRILQKIIDYETTPSQAWKRNFLTANVNLRSDYSDYRFAELLKSSYADPLGFFTYRIYESDYGLDHPPECPAINTSTTNANAPCNMLQEWVNGEGYGVLTWSTHGSQTRAEQLIHSGNTSSLDDTKPTFTFQMSCENGYPENRSNLGYALLSNGSIATVAASRISWGVMVYSAASPTSSRGLDPDISYFYTNKIMSGHLSGQALYDTKDSVNPLYFLFGATGGEITQNLMTHNLYGDPAIRLELPLASRIVDPLDGSAITGSNYTIMGKAFGGTETNIVQVEISPDGTLWNSVVDTSANDSWLTWSYDWALPASDGNYTLRSRATDNAGNVEVPGHEVNVIIDNTAPTSVMTEPQDGEIICLGTQYTLNGTAADNLSGVATIEISIDGSTWTPVTDTSGDDTWSTWSYEWNVPTREGIYRIHNRATDNAGNAEPLDSGARVNVQTLYWTRQIGTPQNDRAMDVSLDRNLNVYVTGNTSGNFNGYSNLGGSDIFVTKIDPKGNVSEIWQMGTPQNDHAKDILVDRNGNIYVAGYTYGSFEGQTSLGGSDYFLIKLDAQGNRLMTWQGGTSKNDYAHKFTVRAGGDIFIAGYSSEAIIRDPLRAKILIIQLNADGSQLNFWEKDTLGNDYITKFFDDKTGNLFLTGYTQDDPDFFVMRYRIDETRQWVFRNGTPGKDYAYGLSVHESNIFATGFTTGNFNNYTNLGGSDIFFVKIDAQGNELKIWQGGTSENDEAYGIAVDAYGDIYIVGATSGILNGDTNAGGLDLFVKKISPY